ncbi:hypothetical protein CR513_45835, partial [Mucuna pruriens]
MAKWRGEGIPLEVYHSSCHGKVGQASIYDFSCEAELYLVELCSIEEKVFEVVKGGIRLYLHAQSTASEWVGSHANFLNGVPTLKDGANHREVFAPLSHASSTPTMPSTKSSREASTKLESRMGSLRGRPNKFNGWTWENILASDLADLDYLYKLP